MSSLRALQRMIMETEKILIFSLFSVIETISLSILRFFNYIQIINTKKVHPSTNYIINPNPTIIIRINPDIY